MTLVLFLLCFVVLFGAAFRPPALVYAVFLLGPLPLGGFLRDPSIATPVGMLHINALLVLAILFASLVGIVIGHGQVMRQVRASSLFFVFLTFSIASTAWSHDISMALRMLLKLITPVVFMVFVAANIERIGTKTIVQAVLASGFFYALATVVSWKFGMSPNHEFALPATSRAVSSGHLLAPLNMALASLAIRPGILWALIALVFSGTILAGFTRITIAGIFVSATTVWFLKVKRVAKFTVPVIVGLGFIALFTLVGTFRDRMFLEKADRMSFESVINDPGAAIASIGGSGRYNAWEYALKMLFSPHPLVGSGVGSTQRLFYDHSGLGVSVVHSEVVRLLCDLGIVGFVLFVLAWVQVTLAMNRRHRLASTREASTIATAALATSAAYLTFLLTDNGFDYVAQIGVFAYGLVGAALGLRATKPPQRLKPQQRWKRAGKRRLMGSSSPKWAQGNDEDQYADIAVGNASYRLFTRNSAISWSSTWSPRARFTFSE